MLFKELEFCILNIFIHLFVAFLIHFLTIGFGNIFFKFISFNWHGWARFRNLMYTFIIIISCVYSRLKTSLNKFSFKMSFNLFLQQECHSKLFALKVSFEIQDYKNGIKKNRFNFKMDTIHMKIINIRELEPLWQCVCWKFKLTCMMYINKFCIFKISICISFWLFNDTFNST